MHILGLSLIQFSISSNHRWTIILQEKYHIHRNHHHMGTTELYFINSHLQLHENEKTQIDETKWPKFPANVSNQLKTGIRAYSNWSSLTTVSILKRKPNFRDSSISKKFLKIELKPANKFSAKLLNQKIERMISTNGNERVLDALLLPQKILHGGFCRSHLLLLLLNLYYKLQFTQPKPSLNRFVLV